MLNTVFDVVFASESPERNQPHLRDQCSSTSWIPSSTEGGADRVSAYQTGKWKLP